MRDKASLMLFEFRKFFIYFGDENINEDLNDNIKNTIDDLKHKIQLISIQTINATVVNSVE